MQQDAQNQDPRDRNLWEIARKRVAFKRHLVTYVAVIGFLWIVWWFTGGEYYGFLPWPAFAALGWGIGLVFHYLDAYVFNQGDPVQKEYEKLKNEQNK